MDLESIEEQYRALVRTMDVAAPVDLAFMFGRGVDARKSLEGGACVLTGEKGVFVQGSVRVDSLRLDGTALFVVGDVVAKTIHLEGTMVVLGSLVAEDVYGVGERHSLTVLGRTTLGRATMERQFTMQFLGSGSIEVLVDTEGGAPELVELLRSMGSVVTVSVFSDDPLVEHQGESQRDG